MDSVEGVDSCGKARRAMRAYLSLLVLAVLACSSGDNLGPNSAPRLGRYSYTFSARSLSASGTMVLTYASADSVAGRFEVAAYTPEMSLGFKNTDAYVIYAHPRQGGLAQHRMRPEGQELVCEWGQYFVSFTDLRPGTCSVSYQGP